MNSRRVIACTSLICAVFVSRINAGTYVVSTLNDSGAGSLRSTISNSASGDTITFSVTGTISLTSGELLITNNLNIAGPGATNLAISAGFLSRVLHIALGSTCSISGLTIRDGRTRNGTNSNVASVSGESGQRGGAILNEEFLSLFNCTFLANTTGNGGNSLVSVRSNQTPGSGGRGGDGGAIFSRGVLLASNCTFSGNSTGVGGGGASGLTGYDSGGCTAEKGGDGGPGGRGGNGAGIYNVGPLTLVNCQFSNNFGGAGRQGAVGGAGGYNGGCGTFAVTGYGGRSGTGGGGAAIWNEVGPALVTNCNFESNMCGQGGLAIIVDQGYGWRSVPAGLGGSGGAVGNQGEMSIVSSTLRNNKAGSGGSQTMAWIYNPTGGDGGAIFSSGWLMLQSNEISTNAGGAGGVTGSGGNGGGIYITNTGGQLRTNVLIACNINANRGGDRGQSTNSTTYQGEGGGLWNGALTLATNCAFVNNSAGTGGGGIANKFSLLLSSCTVSSNYSEWYPDSGRGGGIWTRGWFRAVSCTIVSNSAYVGGGIYNTSNAWLLSTVLLKNDASYPFIADFQGSTLGSSVSEGHSVYSSSGSFYDLSPGPGDSTNVTDLRIAPLAFNGGSTLNHALLPDSPLRDAGDDSLTGTDQRGRPRRSGAHVDIGAFELNMPDSVALSLRKQTNAVVLRYTNTSDLTFSIRASSDAALSVTQWQNFGTGTLVSNGVYEYTDAPVSNVNRRFFILRAP